MQSGEPQFTVVNTAASGDNTLVVAQGAGVKIRVVGFFLVAAGAVTAHLASGAGVGATRTGPMSMITGVSQVAGPGPWGLFETAANALLNLNLSGAVQVSGFIIWVTAQ